MPLTETLPASKLGRPPLFLTRSDFICGNPRARHCPPRPHNLHADLHERPLKYLLMPRTQIHTTSLSLESNHDQAHTHGESVSSTVWSTKSLSKSALFACSGCGRTTHKRGAEGTVGATSVTHHRDAFDQSPRATEVAPTGDAARSVRRRG